MQTYIQRQLVERKLVPAGMSARWIEGYMRLAYSTFNQLIVGRDSARSKACGTLRRARRNRSGRAQRAFLWPLILTD